MNTEQKDIEILEAFIHGELDKNAAEEVEIRLQEDSTFMELYQWLRQLKASTRIQTLQSKHQMLQQIEKNISSTGKKTIQTKKYIWIIGLGLLALILTIWVFNNNQITAIEPTTEIQDASPDLPTSTDESLKDSTKVENHDENLEDIDAHLFAINDEKQQQDERLSWKAMYTVPEDLTTLLRSESQDSSLYDKALQLYSNKKYADAIRILADDLDNPHSLYLTAHSLLLSGKHQQAARLFKDFSQKEFSLFYNESKWYYILALYADYPNSKPELAKALQHISELPESYISKAKTIQNICKC
ncbi:MAG: CDC27 family protein [Chitinophagales bacterium]|nr:CDC27 family protein [Chitinophagales bacterium]